MRFLRLASLLLLFAAPAGARTSVGNFATWAAFCDEPRRCFAISAPVEQSGRPFVTVGITADGPVVRARIGRPVRTATLVIDAVRYDLTAEGEQATADTRTSRRIVAAMRQGTTMTLIATGVRGGKRRLHYLLAGAPSAIDAAIVAALR